MSEPATRLLSATVFTLGCAGLCAMVVWLELVGLALGLLLFAAGWVAAREIESRAAPSSARPPQGRAASHEHTPRKSV
jgi:hypothetical protein